MDKTRYNRLYSFPAMKSIAIAVMYPARSGFFYVPLFWLSIRMVAVFLGGVALMGGGVVSPVWAESLDPYVVTDIRVDVRDESALKARDKAFIEAQTKAFRLLIPRLLPQDPRAASIPVPPEADMARYVSDVEITNERRSTTRYVATYAIRFVPEAVDAYIARIGQTPLNAQPPALQTGTLPPATHTPAQTPPQGSLPYLLVPALQRGSSIDLWSSDNPWRRTWHTNPDSLGLALPQIAVGDEADRTAWPSDRLFTYGATAALGAPSPIGFARHRYRVPTIVIALLNGGAGVAGSVQAGGTRIGSQHITLYRADNDKPVYIDTLIVPATPVAAAEDAFAAARLLVLRYLNNPVSQNKIAAIPVAPAAVSAAPQSGSTAPSSVILRNDTPSLQVTPSGTQDIRRVQLQVQFSSLQEWSQVRQVLGQIPVVQGISLSALRVGQAMVTAQIAGDDAALTNSFRTAGLRLEAIEAPMLYRVTRYGPSVTP